MTEAKPRPPLELTVYPLCTDPSCPAEDDLAHYAEPCGLYTWHADEKAAAKRLTEPELAAEYWRKHGDCDLSTEGYTGDGSGYTYRGEDVEGARLATLDRFASLPHAAEHGYE